MDEQPKYKHIDASSLVDLKAELYKKHESLRQAKSERTGDPVTRKGFRLKGEEFPKKAKQNISQSVGTFQNSDEDEKEFQKSKLALERKAKLYEQILSKKVTLDDDDDEDIEKMYMVDFRKKLLNSENEAVRSANINPENHNNVKISNVSVPPVIGKVDNSSEKVFPSMIDGPSRFNTLTHPANLPNQNEVNTDGPIHYQNVQHNEVRDHGVGYYAFSMDEAKRKEEMESLKTLRQQTEKRKTAHKNAEQKRKTALQARLAKICERRNIDKSIIEDFVSKDDINNEDSPKEKSIDVDLNDIPLPEDIAADPASSKPTKMRPWDEGKEGLGVQMPTTKRKKYTQKDWITERRSERVEEFAPPSAYS